MGVPTVYSLITAVGNIINDVTMVLVGASSIMSNGTVMGRAGSGLIATLANEFRVPVLVCCESYKFSETIRTDSFMWNELGNLI
jgi:translation initiation factor eIF-2B subunit delta